MPDYLIIAEMQTERHGRIRFVSYGNGVFALDSAGGVIVRRDWSPAMKACVGTWPTEMTYWEVELAKYEAQEKTDA
jgi:hypothetical protein